MPSNLYGPGDNYDLESSHVLPALIRKFYNAYVDNKESVICWGTGQPLREFLHVDDLGDACVYTLERFNPDAVESPKDKNGKSINWLNIGSDYEISIKNLAKKISDEQQKQDVKPKIFIASRILNVPKASLFAVYSGLSKLTET